MSYVPVVQPVASEWRYGYPGSWGGGTLDYQYQPWEWPFRPIGRRVRLGFGAFGTTESWLGVVATTNEVYVLRLAVVGAELKAPTDALLFVRAAGRAVASKMELDVRGVAVKPSDTGTTVDVVLTSPKGGVSIVVPSDAALAEAVAADPELRGRFPKLLVKAVLLQLTGPLAAVDHWRSQPILWDQHLGSGGHGGPTDTFAEPAEFSIVKGSADDGKLATPWRQTVPPLGKKAGGGAGLSVGGWVLLALGALVIGYSLKGQGDRR